MLSCMGISGNWRPVVKNLAIRVGRRKFRGGMRTSAHRLKAGLVRKAPIMNRVTELWMVSRIASWEGEVLVNWEKNFTVTTGFGMGENF